MSGENVEGGERGLRGGCGDVGEEKVTHCQDMQLSFHLPYWKEVKGGRNCSEKNYLSQNVVLVCSKNPLECQQIK